MASLELDLLGEFQARAAGVSIDVPGRKERALLAVLALPPGQRHSRDKLAGLLWSDRGDKQARDSLKSAISRLKGAFGSLHPPPIISERECVSLDREKVAVDVAAFERLIGEGTAESIARAITVYRGDLLESLDVRDPVFEEWLLLERQRLRVLVRDALGVLLDRHLAIRAHDSAAAVAHRLLALDPLREAAHRALMQIYAEQGQTALALKQYQFCRDTLQRELSVKPEPETDQLYRSIQEKRAAIRSTVGESKMTLSETKVPPGASPRPEPEAAASMKPAIAVLPFENLTGDLEQEYFADGMVEEIITALSRLRWLFVIARNSSFTYKGRAVDVKQVGRELGVRYVLEGSVRKGGNRVRITGQLIDASTGAHIWADRFEGGLEDIFELQDQVTASVVGAIAPKLEQAEIERAKHKLTESLDAYDYYLRGLARIHQWAREANNEALRLFNKAIERDPEFSQTYAKAAHCYVYRKVNGWMIDRAQEVADAERLARRAIELGRDDSVALSYAGMALGYVVGDLDDGAAYIDRALSLNVNLASAWGASSWMKTCFGDLETAIQHAAHATRLSPVDPGMFLWQSHAALAHLCAGRYADAASVAEAALRDQSNYAYTLRVAAASYAMAGRLAEAQKAMARLRQVDPQLRLSNLGEIISPIRQPEHRANYVEGLRKAGLPE